MNKNKIKDTASLIKVAKKDEDEAVKFVSNIVNEFLEKNLDMLVKQKMRALFLVVENLKAQLYVVGPQQKAQFEARIDKYTDAMDEMMKLNKAINRTNIRSAKIIDALLEKGKSVKTTRKKK